MNILNKEKIRTEYFYPKENHAHLKLGKSLIKMLEDLNFYEKKIVVLCIGTDRATGDALGPLVGDILSSAVQNLAVFGTLMYPVHALNIKETLQKIYTDYENPLVIAIDASLGLRQDVGCVTLTNSFMYPGKGVNKKLPAIGDISITGIVNVSHHAATGLLQNTRLYTVKAMSDLIANGLIYAFDYLSVPL